MAGSGGRRPDGQVLFEAARVKGVSQKRQSLRRQMIAHLDLKDVTEAAILPAVVKWCAAYRTTGRAADEGP
jgi:hypothetical protein